MKTTVASESRISDIEEALQNGKQALAITPPNFQVAEIEIVGTAPYVQNRFPAKARQMMKSKQEAGSQSKKGQKREPKNFTQCFEEAQYHLSDGGFGIPAGSFRAAMVDACRLVGFHMTKGKCGIFIIADGEDASDKTPLVRITKGKPEKVEHFVRNETGVADIRARAAFDEGWRVKLRIRFDGDMFKPIEIMNLLARAGIQIGIGEGRPFSPKSCGMGWGTFRPLTDKEVSR